MKDESFVRVTLRLPKALHEQIAAEADRKASTTNAEVVARLERSLLENSYPQTSNGSPACDESFQKLKDEIELMLDRKLISLAMALRDGGAPFGKNSS